MIRPFFYWRAAAMMALAATLITQPAPLFAELSDAEPERSEGEPLAPVDDTPAEPGDSENKDAKTFLERTATAHMMVSSGLESMARNIDSFFAEDKSFDEATSTYARLRIDTTLDEDLQLGFDGDLKIKIDLPRTERQLKLLIESDTKEGIPDRPDESPVNVLERQDYLLSIESVNKAKDWDIRPAAGIKLRWNPDLFLRLRASRYRSLNGWLERTSGSVFWFTNQGFGANTALEYDRRIGQSWLFRSASSLRWEENDQFLTAEQRVSLYQELDQRQYLVYQLGVVATQDPHWAVTQYNAAVHYRKDVYKNWLFIELIPQINFLEEHDFDAEPSITFRVEGVFGREYL